MHLRELIKELQSIEAIVDFRPDLAKERLFGVIEKLRKEAKNDRD